MKTLLVGYYGYHNTGDDVLLTKTQELVTEKTSSKTIWVLSPSNNQDSSTINRWNLFAILKVLFFGDLIVFGGGGLLQNKTSNLSLFYYLSIILFSHIFRKKTVLLAQGIGPIKGKVSQFFVKWILYYVHKISLRSQESGHYLNLNSRVKITGDLAFYKAQTYSRKLSDLSNHVGINICTFNCDLTIQLLKNELVSSNFNVSGLSFCPSVDKQILEKSGFNTLDITAIDRANYYNQSLLQYKFLVLMRYHACIWAILQGIPFIAITYDEKVLHLARLVKQPVLTLDEFGLKESRNRVIINLTRNLMFYQDNIINNRDSLIKLSQNNEWIFK
ncbi:hypothetical protein CL657_02895 [bacterium]|nr:hypothetical protein [bacterium]